MSYLEPLVPAIEVRIQRARFKVNLLEEGVSDAVDSEIVAISQSNFEASIPPMHVAFPSCLEIALDSYIRAKVRPEKA